MPQSSNILTLSCPDRPGIVARVSAFLFERGCNILDAQQFDDEATGRFFMRVVFAAGGDEADLRLGFEIVAAEYGMHWTLRRTAERRKVMILVSGLHHCLADLLFRWRLGELPMEITAVVSNHPIESFGQIDLRGVAFHHLPVSRET